MSGRISADTTWTLANSPYLVTSTVQVYGTSTTPVTLTIEPGVLVKFNSGTGLQIGDSTNQGSLVSQGTATNHIIFTRSGTSGTWSGITFNDKTVDSTAVLEYSDIQYSTGITMNSASPTIRNSTITNVTGYGLNLSYSNPTIDMVTITNTGTYGINLSSSSPTITGGSLTNSSPTGHGIYGTGSPVISNYNVSIVNAATYYGLFLSTTTSAFSLTNSTIANGLYINQTGVTPTITGNTFTNVDNSPIRAGANIILPILNNNTINGMTSAGRIEVVGEQVKQDARWMVWPAPYVVVSGNVSAYKDTTGPATLTIDPGVTIKFASGAGLQVGNGTNQGALVAQGTAANHITFTRNGTSGTWPGITFNDGTIDSTTDLEYVDVQYSTGVTMSSASPAIKNSTIAINNSTGYGLNLSSSNPTLENVAITHDGTIAINLSSSSPTIIGGSLINTNAAGHGISGSGSPVISNYSVSIVNSTGKYGVYLSSGSTSALSITNSAIANGLFIGSTGIMPTITGNTFSNADASPIHAGANIIAQIMSGNTITGMTSAGRIEIVGEQVKQDARWTVWPAPYVVVSGNVSVYKDTTGPATLTIDPGVTIKFASSSSLQIGNSTNQGALVAQGTAANHITFTRNGTSGTWPGITFNDGTIDGTTDLEYVDVQYSTGVTMSSASPAIKNSTIAINNSTGYGLNLSSSNPTLENVAITHDGTIAINLSSSSPTIIGGSLINTNTAGQGISGSGSPVISNYSVSIVNSPGKYGVYLSNGSTSGLSITNSTVANGLYIGTTSITPTITGNTFTNVDNSPVHAGANIIAQLLANNTISGMTSAGRIEVVPETINQNTRWQKWASPYVVVSGTVYVYKDTTTTASLTIDPGTVIKFNTGASMQIGNGSSKGVLVAKGTSGNSILFTSSQATPAPGNWNGVTLSGDASGASDIEYTTVEYAGSGTNYNNANLTVNSSAPVLRNCLIRNSSGSGLYLTNATSFPVIMDSEITGNKWGIYSYGSNPYITNTKIYSNTTAGAWNASTTPDVDARDNWWGVATGPTYSSNPTGTGDKISDHVAYNPWLGQAAGTALTITEAKVLPSSLNPDGDYVTFTAKISVSANWTISITDGNNSTIKAFTGTGTNINQKWYGTDNQAVKVADGSYYYTINAVDPLTGNSASGSQGLVTVSRQIPIAIMDPPSDNQMFPCGSTINITGTASDSTDFNNYTVVYGSGENPSSWTSLKSSTIPVSNGLLHAWNTSSLTGYVYTAKLTVIDSAGNTSIETSRVRFLCIQNAASSEGYISPNADGVKDSTNISSTFTQQSDWTLTIKNASGAAVRTYTGNGTMINQGWDGKDASGQVVPDGTYSLQIDAQSPETGVSVSSNIGAIIVDTTNPITQITLPLNDAVLESTVQITGTVSDTNFDSYRVEYGPSSGSGPWTVIATVTSAASGTLATWIPYDPANGSVVPDGNYMLRVVAADKAGNTATAAVSVNVGFLILSNVSSSSHTLNTYTSDSGAIFFAINEPATVTFKIVPEKQGAGGVPVYQTSQQCAAAGTYSFSWNGRDQTGKVVPDEAYLYILEATNGSKTYTYSPSAPSGTGSVTCSQSASYDPYRNEPLTINYSVAQPSRVKLSVNFSGGTFKVMDSFPYVSGSYTIDWNGRASDGRILAGGTAVVQCTVASLLGENVIITSGDTPKVTLLKTDPFDIQLSYGEYTKITYNLSRDSNVTATLISTTGTIITLLDNQPQIVGAHEIQWDGTDPSDASGKKLLLLTEGDYTVSIQAVNASTGASSSAKGCLRMWR